tara:strand:- start:14174 stop:16375 length:2202 start_codon:yes stop_codon:yes gene_type:complete
MMKLASCLFASVSLGVLVGHGGAIAQQEDDTSTETSLRIETVTVTAQRREESLQTVPITVTAFSGAMIEQKGLDNVQSIADATPGLSMDSFPRTTPRPSIRGIGSSNQSAGADPSSVAFLDGVYLGRGPMLSVDGFDIERVEVLKGPQGTLWGKNVVGGAISFITKKPVDEFELHARATYADYGQQDYNLVLNTPVTDRLLTRIALSSKKNDGFRTNLNTGGPLDDDERISGRFHALYKLDDATDILFTVDGTSDDTAGPARFNIAPNGSKDLDDPDAADPDQPGYLERDTWGTKFELNSSALRWADLTTYISYRALDNSTSEDFDGTTPAGNAANGVPVAGIQVVKEEQADSLSAEFRLATSFDGPFNWVGGAFALRDTVDRERESETSVPDLSENRYVATNVTESFGAFGEGRYDLTSAWTAFAGLRFTDETKEYEIRRLVGDRSNPTVDYTTYGNPGVSDEQKWTWRIGSDYQFNPNVFLFGTISTGFKSGAFQEQPNAATAQLATAPETVINYEVGMKSDFWSGRGRANISVFNQDYSDLQTIQVIDDATQGPGGSRVVTDTGNATIRGVETEFQWLPSENMRLGLLYTYLDATFDNLLETQEILADGTPIVADLSGNRLSRTPEHALALSASYETDDYGWGSLLFGVDANYQSKIFDDNSNNNIETRDPRTLLNAFMTYRATEQLSVQFWAHNITDEEYRVHQAATAGGHFVQYGTPRQVGVTATFDF